MGRECSHSSLRWVLKSATAGCYGGKPLIFKPAAGHTKHRRCIRVLLLVSNDLVICFCGRQLQRRPPRRQTAPSSGVAASQAAPPPAQPAQPRPPHSSLSRDNTLRPPFPSVQRCLLALPVLSQTPQRLNRRWPADLPNAPPAADSFQRPKPSAPCLTARQFRLPTLPSSPTTSSRAYRPTSPRPTQTAPGWSAICRASFPAAS